jgi:lipoprotein-anchoring transpeptidase ErfK/SrfK
MGRHRLERPSRVRPRYGRMAAAGLSLLVTLVALLGGIGVIPLDASGSGDEAAAAAPAAQQRPPGTSPTATASPTRSGDTATLDSAAAAPADPTALPAASGAGRRVVFSIGSQRVWLVGADGAVQATYLVSGSVTDNLAPGRYDVYSRSRWAVGVDDSGTMQYFVRFAHGRHAAIGFHSIPTKHGRPLQTEAQLGTPQSHGCIRQRLSDAAAMWAFARIGTDVVVLA